jgi:hypothetical protein
MCSSTLLLLNPWVCRGERAMRGWLDLLTLTMQETWMGDAPHPGSCFCQGGTAISWANKLQKLAALSTVEAEFISMCSGVQEALWLSKLASDLGGELGAAVNYSDNTGALANVRGIPISPRTKHIGVRFHRIRGEVERGAINPTHVPTEPNIADLFTKSLGKFLFEKFRALLGLVGL